MKQERDTTAHSRSLYVLMGVTLLGLALVFGAVMVYLARTKHVETLKLVAGAFVTLLSTLVGAGVAFTFARLQIREQNDLSLQNAARQRDLDVRAKNQELAFEMHREFCGTAMLQARTEATRLLEAHPELSYHELDVKFRESEARPLFLVSGFYDRLSLALQHHRIDAELVPTLFGPYFIWWWLDAFRDRLVGADPDWPESVRLKWLHGWFERNSTEAEMTLWSSRAAGVRSPEAKPEGGDS